MVDSEKGYCAAFYFGGDSKCEHVLSEIALLDSIFEVLMKRLALGNLMSWAVEERVVILHSRDKRDHVASIPNASTKVDP